MHEPDKWDWSMEKKVIADLSQLKEDYEYHESPVVSPDGEKIALIVKNEDEEYTVCENGTAWEEASFDKVWGLKYTPDNKLACFASDLGEWTVVIDGESWETTADYMWNLGINSDGSRIIAAAQKEGKYLLVNNDVPWEKEYGFLSDVFFSKSGEHAGAVVQVVPLSEGETFKFKEGCYTAAINGDAWDTKFVNVWEPVFSSDGKHAAAQVRTGMYEYSIAVDGKPWDKKYQCVWKPQFHPQSDSVTAPVRLSGAWTLAKDNEILWKRSFMQLWHHQYSAKGDKIAAIVSPKYGKWTLALDGKAWKNTFNDYVTDLTFSHDGNRLACVACDKGKLFVVVDDDPWGAPYDMVWKPVFSPDSKNVAVKVERNGRYCLAVNERLLDKSYDYIWDPIFSSDGQNILVRGIEKTHDNKESYIREVIPVSRILS